MIGTEGPHSCAWTWGQSVVKVSLDGLLCNPSVSVLEFLLILNLELIFVHSHLWNKILRKASIYIENVHVFVDIAP